HSRPAAKRLVIDGLEPVVRPVPQISNLQIKQPGLPCPPHHAHIERSHEHFGKQGEHVDFHAPCNRQPAGLDSTTSNMQRVPLRALPACNNERMALIVTPCLPMIRPMSSALTRNS